MNPAFRSLLLAFAVVMTAKHAAAQEWHGIKPLKSTRADVVRVFGECADKEKPCVFLIENEDVWIDFSSAQNCHGAPADTVLLVKRVLVNTMPIKAMGVDLRRFKSFDPARWRKAEYRAFVDENSGLLFKTLRGEVFEIYDIGAKTDRQACSNYSHYANIRELLSVWWEHVFMINAVNCPPTAIDGERVVIDADYAGTGQRRIPTWITTGGRIVAGQGTRKILLDTTGMAGKVFTVTVEVDDGSHHTASGSCSISVSAAPKN